MSDALVLLVDTDPQTHTTVSETLEGRAQLRGVTDASAAEACLRVESFDLVVLEEGMVDTAGDDLFDTVVRKWPRVPVVLTGRGAGVASAVQAIRRGAADFLPKPVDARQLIGVIDRLSRDGAGPSGPERVAQVAAQLVGETPGMRNIYAIAARAADSDSTVLITGESGTGKELIARAIHYGGRRRTAPFVPIDCSALNPNLIESELFGHVKGAFTSAFRAKEGMLRMAGSGTVFLDEIGEIPPAIQSKLLRAIQERSIRPVGGTDELRFHARIIAATNRNLREEVQAGRFREDLFFRLNVISLQVPPLRERREDITLLLEHFLAKYARDGRRLEGLTAVARQAMLEYPWPGNVRELENAVERAYALARGPMIDRGDLPPRLLEAVGDATEPPPAGASPNAAPAMAPIAAPASVSAVAADAPVFDDREVRPLWEVERDAILHALDVTGGNRREAARLLGIGKSTLYRKLKSYGHDVKGPEQD